MQLRSAYSALDIVAAAIFEGGLAQPLMAIKAAVSASADILLHMSFKLISFSYSKVTNESMLNFAIIVRHPYWCWS